MNRSRFRLRLGRVFWWSIDIAPQNELWLERMRRMGNAQGSLGPKYETLPEEDAQPFEDASVTLEDRDPESRGNTFPSKKGGTRGGSLGPRHESVPIEEPPQSPGAGDTGRTTSKGRQASYVHKTPATRTLPRGFLGTALKHERVAMDEPLRSPEASGTSTSRRASSAKVSEAHPPPGRRLNDQSVPTEEPPPSSHASRASKDRNPTYAHPTSLVKIPPDLGPWYERLEEHPSSSDASDTESSDQRPDERRTARTKTSTSTVAKARGPLGPKCKRVTIDRPPPSPRGDSEKFRDRSGGQASPGRAKTQPQVDASLSSSEVWRLSFLGSSSPIPQAYWATIGKALALMLRPLFLWHARLA